MATWFGTGLVEPFQGFLAALTIVPLLWMTTVRGRWIVPLVAFVPVAVMSAVAGGLWFSLTGVADDGRIVIDEAAGMFVAGLGGWRSRRWTLAIAPVYSFVDRIKPWPLSQAEFFRKTDMGVLLDDCAVGLAVALVVLFVRVVLWRLVP